MAKKYVVREGFIVNLELENEKGDKRTRTYEGGEEVVLEDDQAALHLHKLEFASQKDRDAALEAERKADIATKAQQSPAELVQALIAALSQAQAGAGLAQVVQAEPAA